MRYLKRGLLFLGILFATFIMLSVTVAADTADSIDDSGPTSGICTYKSIDTRIKMKAEMETADTCTPLAMAVDEPSEIFLQRAPERSDYSAFDRLDPTGLVLGVRYKSGAIGTAEAGEISISYESGDSLRVADRVAYAEYCGLRAEIPVTVRPREYELDISFEDMTVEYDGKGHTVDYKGELVTGLDGVPLSVQVIGEGTDVGKYNITLHFYTESAEYFAPPSMNATLTVVPREVRAEWGDLDLTYNGSVQAPSAYYIDVFGSPVPLEVLGGGVNASDGYIATALCRDSNYSIVNDMARFTIERAVYDMSAVTWVGGDFTYNAQTQRVTLAGLPLGVSVGEYIGAEATEAGNYTASATLIFDEVNYYPPTVEPIAWQIARAKYDLSGFFVYGGDVIYDGNEHFASVEGHIPPGLDGSRLTYALVGSATNVVDGRVSSSVVFTADSKNYIIPQPISVEITVLPRPVRVIWGAEDLTYNGEIQAPSAYCERCEVTVEASGCDAGAYIAVAYTTDPNYLIENPRLEYRIERAVNAWQEEPRLENALEGEVPKFLGSPLSGEPVILYYEDAECTRKIAMPTSVGVYYAVAVVAESKNYGSIASEVMSFEVKAVLPIGIRASLRDGVTLRAFDIIGDGYITAYVIFNNGTEEAVDASRLGIEYEQGNSLRASDSYVTVSYQGHTSRIPVTVERAVYDMSSVKWQNNEHIYDGNAKHPTLTGLPSGVYVVEYLGTGAVNAGEYTVTALLEYDRENFEPPTAPVGRLVIEKCPVTPAFSIRPTYDGEPKSPNRSELFYPLEECSFINAGEYRVPVGLYDEDNFYLTTRYASFVISPRRLQLELADIELYLFERAENFGYTIIGGSVLDGEDPRIVCYESAGRIYAYSSNPNYTLDIVPGRIISLGRLSPIATRVALWFLFFILFVISLAVIVIALRARRILPILAVGGRLKVGRKIERLMSQNPTESLAISAERADALLSDAMAKTLIRRSANTIRTSGRRSCIINVDTLGESFAPGDVVDINRLKEKGLVPRDASRLRVLGRGTLDKPLVVYANHFSLSAVKMIALTGGEVNRVSTIRYGDR